MARNLTLEKVNNTFGYSRFNCMGYALDTPDWMYVSIIDSDMKHFGYERCEFADIILGKYEGIAYRYGSCDWHFAYIAVDGSITHKPGCMLVQTMTTEELLYPEGWCATPLGYYYDSPITFYRREVKQ